MERRDLLKMGVVLGAAAIAVSRGVPAFPRVHTAEGAHQGHPGLTLADGVVDGAGRVLDPRNPNNTSPRPLSGDILFYNNYQDVLGGNRKDGRPLVERGYSLNAESDNVDYRRNWEGNPFSMTAFQGEEIDIPGLGSFVSQNDRQSVVVTLMYMDKEGIAWRRGAKYSPIKVVAGFIEKDQVVDGSSQRDVLEERYLGHWISKQFRNDDYKGITGVADQARSVLYGSFVIEGGRRYLVRSGVYQRPSGV